MRWLLVFLTPGIGTSNPVIGATSIERIKAAEQFDALIESITGLMPSQNFAEIAANEVVRYNLAASLML